MNSYVDLGPWPCLKACYKSPAKYFSNLPAPRLCITHALGMESSHTRQGNLTTSTPPYAYITEDFSESTNMYEIHVELRATLRRVYRLQYLELNVVRAVSQAEAEI